MSKGKDPKPAREGRTPAEGIERLEERELLSLVYPKKSPTTPPYPPGTRYGLVRRENLPVRQPAPSDRRKEGEPAVERLEERVALSLLVPKKKPSPPPYAPGTVYGLAKRANIPAQARGPQEAPPAVERLEERVALSLLVPKKKPLAPPYPPGADYSLARRENLRW